MPIEKMNITNKKGGITIKRGYGYNKGRYIYLLFIYISQN